MTKRKALPEGVSVNPPGEETASNPPLTFRQQKFCEAYIDNGGNGRRAYATAFGNDLTLEVCESSASRLLRNGKVSSYIATRREQIKELIGFNREKYLRIIAATATAKLSDFVDVLKNPEKKQNYKNLGDLEYALEEASTSTKLGNKIKLSSRKDALEKLNDILGLAKEKDQRDRGNVLAEISGLSERLGRERENK
jgi:hypothetical protein